MRSARALATLLFLAAFAAGCSRQSQPQAVLNEAIFSEPASFDPRAQVDAETYGIMYAIYNTLVELDDSMKIAPALAERWESKDFKTWRFVLRSDVKFQKDKNFKTSDETRTVTARDIEYSLNRALQPGGVGAFVLTDIVEGAKAVNDGKATSASGIKAVDDRTLEIALTKPYSKLLERLATPFLFIVPREAVEAYGDGFGRHPVGTGAFQLDSISPGQAVRLKRNALFWRSEGGARLPYLEGINFRVFRDPQAAVNEFRAGNLDTIEVPPTLAGTVLKDGRLLPDYQKFRLMETVALDSHYYAFRMDRPPFRNNAALRRALNLAVDKQRIANTLLNGLARPSIGVLPPGVYPDVKRQAVYSYDPEQARKALAEAGHPGGKGLPELVLAIDDKATTAIVAQYVQSSLKEIGVNVRLRKSDFNTLLAEVGQGKADFFYMFWEGTDPNAEIFMVQFKSDLLPEKGGYNFGRYSNPKADALYAAAVAELDGARAQAKWLEMQDTVVGDVPWVFLYHTTRMRLLQPTISGYEHNPVQIRRYVMTKKAAP